MGSRPDNRRCGPVLRLVSGGREDGLIVHRGQPDLNAAVANAFGLGALVRPSTGTAETQLSTFHLCLPWRTRPISGAISGPPTDVLDSIY